MTLIAFHLLQNHAPSNLNRDDNGDPKDCLFGTIRRARISSQALKRSIRRSDTFIEAFAETGLLAERTKRMPEWVRDELTSFDLTDDERDAILHHARNFGKGDSAAPVAAAGDDAAQEPAGKKSGKGKPAKKAEALETAQLMFLSQREVRQLTAWLAEQCRAQGAAAFRALKTEDQVKEFTKANGLLEPHAVDVAMFGRMTTSSPFKDIDAAVQVAHAFSTHKIEPEFDFYTAVDDRATEPGAGMLGDTAFNSATYYKYVNVHVEGLAENLNHDRALAAQAVKALLEAVIMAIPSGKQNSFAAYNLPDYVLVEVLAKNVPLSYANAFIKPVRGAGDTSLMDASVQALNAYAGTIAKKFGLPMERAVFATTETSLAGAHDCPTLADLQHWLDERLATLAVR